MIKPHTTESGELEMTKKMEEPLRFFWMGKTARVRACIEEYLEGIKTGNRVALHRVRKKHGVGESNLRRRLKELRDSGLIALYLKKEAGKG